MKHVLVIPSWYPSMVGDAGGSFFREQAIELARAGCKVGVVYPELRSLKLWRPLERRFGDYTVADDEGVATFRWRGFNWFPRVTAGIKHLWIKHGLELFERYIHDHGKPDLLHSHAILYGGVLGARISTSYNIPLVITEHSSGYALGGLRPSELALAKLVAATASELLCVSDHLGSTLRTALATPKAWRTVPNMVSEDFLSRPFSQPTQRRSFSFINVGLANANKRQANIIRAFADSFQATADCRLTICGDGPELPGLKELAHSLRVADRVKFAGALPRRAVLEEVAAADAFVLSSAYETFGLALVEALALGKPVISTRCGGSDSIVRPTDGILVPVDDPTSMARAMLAVYEGTSVFSPAEIRRGCEKRFGPRAVIERLMKVYGECIFTTQPSTMEAI
jgi:glycosyltransferase involved in cell wall biosynthesis